MALTNGGVDNYWSQDSYFSSPSEPSGLGELDFSNEQWTKQYVNGLATPTLESHGVQAFFKQYMESEGEHPVTESCLPNCQLEATREELRRDCDNLIGVPQAHESSSNTSRTSTRGSYSLGSQELLLLPLDDTI